MTDLALAQATEVTGLTCDSRKVEPGILFAALPGAKADGRAFIGQAIERGAAAVLAPPGTEFPPPGRPLPVLFDDNPRRRYALMAARLFPGQPSHVAAVTGTNGKTSTVSFLRQIWTKLGKSAASLGTLGVTAPGLEIAGGLTTPDPVDLHRRLAQLHEAGVDHLAMEASSHGLDQYRLDGVKVAAAAFTNLSRDHLDYHGTMEDYLASKMRLFTEIVRPGGAAVINADAPEADAIRAACADRRLKVFTYGRAGETVRLETMTPVAQGQRLAIAVSGRTATITMPLLGAFQAENALCALTLALALGEDPLATPWALESLEGPAGRLEWVTRHPSGAPIVVDYAHTPDALETVLKALRPHTAGKLHVVFGCGGDRDPGKRPEMGRIATDNADAVIITDDNPRSEEAAEIRRQILTACPGATEIGDRMEAIRSAVTGLGSGDLLLIAGKGHETGQIIGNTVLPFDDREAARKAVEEGAS